MKKTAVIIPARYASTRLPGKPLLKVNNKPIIQYVYEVALKAKLADDVIVATDDDRILNAVKNFKGNAELTSENCKSGSDRVFEVAMRHSEFEYIINLQGDEPQITPDIIDIVIKNIKQEHVDISTLVRIITDKNQIDDPNCVKCVFDNDFNALYFSRCPIPYERNKNNSPYYAHIGIYGYKRNSLIKMNSLKQTPLELQESLEQLRALQNGMKIKVALVNSNPIGIDTQADFELFKKMCEK